MSQAKRPRIPAKPHFRLPRNPRTKFSAQRNRLGPRIADPDRPVNTGETPVPDVVAAKKVGNRVVVICFSPRFKPTSPLPRLFSFPFLLLSLPQSVKRDLRIAFVGPFVSAGSLVRRNEELSCVRSRRRTTKCVKLVGIRWAILSTTGKRFVVYSPIGSMNDGQVKGVQNSNNDLGPLKKCSEGAC
jgi:hypothetical protein